MQLRNYMPKTLFARMLAIILVPMLLVQCITVLIFYERHWDSVTRHMAYSLSGEISYIVSQAGSTPTMEDIPALQMLAGRYFGFSVLFTPDAILPPENPDIDRSFYAYIALSETLNNRIDFPWSADLTTDEDLISVDIQLGTGVLRIYAGRKRLFSSTSWTFLGWTIGSSLILFCIALLFLQGQVRPIRQLANAARQLGLGRQTDDWQLSGAREVRLAGRAFQSMRHRINRQLTERTSMLAGVSHDLRTPLTRMRLQLAMMTRTVDVDALENDVVELESMIDGYLAFARGEGEEHAVSASLYDMLILMVSGYQKSNPGHVTLTMPDNPLPLFPIRAVAMRRALDNLIANAVRYADKSEVRVKFRNDVVNIFVDDDGPGIEPELREQALRPFVRLEASRNRGTGGTGLGLAIAADIIAGHGGELILDASPQGGLRVHVKLPV